MADNKMKQQTVLCLVGIAVLVVVAYFLFVKKEGYDYVVRDLPTSPEVESIEGRPNFDVVNRATGEVVIGEGDIALSPGFGIGEGTVGFGRYGSSFMA